MFLSSSRFSSSAGDTACERRPLKDEPGIELHQIGPCGDLRPGGGRAVDAARRNQREVGPGKLSRPRHHRGRDFEEWPTR